MPYYPFSAGSITLAEEMMSNYYHIAGGNQYPYSVSANGGFTLASATYNIGASTTTFQDVFCDSLYISDSVASADKSLWYLIAEQTLSDTAVSIEFTGLTGNDEQVYRIFCKSVANTGSMLMIINGDSGTNYGSQYVKGQSTGVVAARDTTNDYIIVGFLGGITATTKVSYSENLLFAKSGNERLHLSSIGEVMTGDFINAEWNYANIWNNTADEITSLKFYNLVVGSYLTGTNIQIWGRG